MSEAEKYMNEKYQKHQFGSEEWEQRIEDLNAFHKKQTEKEVKDLIDVIRELELQLNYSCYDEEVLKKTQNVWAIITKLKES